MNAEAQLKIAIPSLTNSLNHLEIHSVSEYVIFDDLLRSLIKFDSNGELAPDLAESWEVLENYSKFNLKIKSNQFFSDHSLITITDIYNSLKNIQSNPSIIHGDGKKIKKISIINDSHIQIELTESNPFFLAELSSPEYRIVKFDKNNYSITSGPYSLINSKSHSKNIILKLNEFFPFGTQVKYKEVSYTSYQNMAKDQLNTFDIIWPSSTMSLKEIQSIIKSGFYSYQLNLGFSYWLSINPSSLSKNERIIIKNKLDAAFKNSDFFSRNNLTRSKQLFLPYGPGRLSDVDIDFINAKQDKVNVQNLKKISMLLPKSIQTELLNIIKLSIGELNIDYYSDFAEYSKLIKLQNYDVALVNNDLSSIDLRSSLIVTFNNTRPLVWTEKHNQTYTSILNNIKTELNSIKRYSMIKQLGENLLKDVIVYPLYYDYGFVLVKNGIDLSQLNKSGAETFSWKIK